MPRLRSRANLTARSAVQTATTTRPRRGTATQPPPAAVVERSSPKDARQSLNLTVKASPNKLRKATGGATSKTAVSAQNIVSGKRARTSRVVQEVDSDEEEEEEEEEAEAMDIDEDDDEDEDEDAEGEDEDEDEEVDAEGEEDDDDVSPAPPIVATNNHGVRKPSIGKPQDAVEAKEMVMADDDDDDEELSEPESEEVEEEDEEEEGEGEGEGEDEDAEGEEDEELIGENEEEEDEEMESEDESRDQTPDLSKLTRRQRAMHVEDSDGGLMALSNGAWHLHLRIGIFAYSNHRGSEEEAPNC